MTKLVILMSVGIVAIAMAAEQQTVTVKMDVPDSAWRIDIDGVYQVSNEILVVAVVSRDPNAMGAQVISSVKDSVKVEAPVLPIKYHVIGKTWGWKNKEPYLFLKDRKTIQQKLDKGKRLYTRTKK